MHQFPSELPMPACIHSFHFCLALSFSVLLTTPAGLRPAAAETAAIPPVKDNTLFSDPDGALSSGSGPHLFAGNNSVSNTRRAVVAFDVVAYVPEGASIDSVALVLNVSSAPNDTPQWVALHRVLAGWGEGASVSSGGGGAPSEPGDATWLHTFYPNEFWSTSGGDFDSTPSATLTAGTSGPHVWTSESMRADVQQWLDDPATAFGWLLMGDEAAASTVRRFDSHEHSTPGNRPYLFVSYTPPVTAAESTTWGAVKARYVTSPPSSAAADRTRDDAPSAALKEER